MVEGAPHTVKTMINLCVYGVPPSLYIKEQGGEGRPRGGGAPKGGVLLAVGV